jgi:hypothetical protein
MIKRVARDIEVVPDLMYISMVSYDVACRRSAVVNEIGYWRFIDEVGARVVLMYMSRGSSSTL